MRPHFNMNTCYIPLLDGVYLRNNNHRLILKGKSLYPLLNQLIPHLNGKTTLEALTEGLSVDKTNMVTRLIEKLFAHQLLKDADQPQDSFLHLPLLQPYTTNIAFSDSLHPSLSSHFPRFRDQRLLLIGSPGSSTLLLQAALQSGVRLVGVMIVPQNSGDLFDIPSPYDPEQIIHMVDAPSWNDESEVRNSIASYDTVLHIADQPMVRHAQLLNKLCLELHKTCIQAVVVDDHAWIGPLVRPGIVGCWECAWRRLQSTMSLQPDISTQYAFLDPSPDSSYPSRSSTIIDLIAHRLVFELFKDNMDLAATSTDLIAIDLETCQTERHSFLLHPLCTACQHPTNLTASQFLMRIQHLQHQEPLDADTLAKNIIRSVEPRTGLFTTLHDNNFVQVPLAIYKASLSSPMSGEDYWYHNSIPNVIAAGSNTAQARLRTFQRACECYAATVVDQRRLLDCQAAFQYPNLLLSNHQIIGAPLSLPKEGLWTWALDVQTQQPYLVSAAQVFCSPPLHQQEPERRPGIASGMSWDEALCRGLLDWGKYLTIAGVRDRREPYPQVDLASVPMTPTGTYLSQLLASLGQLVTLYNVTGTLQIPTFAISMQNQVIAYSTHYDVAVALEMGIEQAVQQYQAEQWDQPECAIPPVPDLPLTLRAPSNSVPHYALPDTWATLRPWLLQRFQTIGLRAFAVPLDHDPGLVQLLPFIVRVLLTTGEEKHGHKDNER